METKLPPRNRSKPAGASTALYHVYNRGANRAHIFRSAVDYREFVQCLKRYLDGRGQADRSGRRYTDLSERVEVIAYCLMPNHFHLIIRQLVNGGMAELMKRAMTGYSMYFNARYGRSGRLFEGPYRAAPIEDPHYARAAIAYVHANHPQGPGWPMCSHAEFVGERESDWLATDVGLRVFGGRAGYMRHMDRYLAARATERTQIKDPYA